ncbi:MAG: YkgJ family cysteine cluster protein [Anaerolineae bacterium]|nr:YkgJ family cysteine cluster protein [Anaerolineae bacterium]
MGTNQKQPRCVALGGEMGAAVYCAIYERRPTPCREFGVTWKTASCASRRTNWRAANRPGLFTVCRRSPDKRRDASPPRFYGSTTTLAEATTTGRFGVSV